MTGHSEPNNPAAGNGILSRRLFLEGALVAGAAGAGVSSASAEPLTVQPWMKVPGTGFAGYGQPSRFENKVVRVRSAAAKSGDARCRRGTHAAAPARRNDHALRACTSNVATPAFQTSILISTGWSSMDW